MHKNRLEKDAPKARASQPRRYTTRGAIGVRSCFRLSQALRAYADSLVPRERAAVSHSFLKPCLAGGVPGCY